MPAWERNLWIVAGTVAVDLAIVPGRACQFFQWEVESTRRLIETLAPLDRRSRAEAEWHMKTQNRDSMQSRCSRES